MQSPFITELNQQNFMQVLESSQQTPLLIHFWASISPESSEIIPQLQQIAQNYNGAMTLALLNCEQEQAIAAQFGVQALPTIALFIDGKPVDGLGGPQSIQAVEAMLAKHLPSQDELNLNRALELVANSLHTQALPMLNALPPELINRGDVKLALTDCYLETQDFDKAAELLQSIPLEYQDNYYKGLIAKLEIHNQAANSPEIQSLEKQFSAEPSNAKLAQELALNYHQVNRDEEALELIWQFIVKDLNALDGDLKKSFMDILSALGQGNKTAAKYRSRLYSILY
ncbi:co-chaperone YbbN [Vibrio sp. 404]|uniref:Co-chaperone YbbN n=1 Tax=Vibrio marinisediminis TaxID=2758441 RepID=A0A7W2FSF6_9VIBR|nr:co-chaperone YbbN [Vibrio marinisediminis]MBA5763428.1 co-chaperone YbbN [Vibrio marinisediminis]